MKIAIIAHLKFPIAEPFSGGLERHTHLLAASLRMRGHAVTLFAAEGSDAALNPVEVCRPTGDPRDKADERRINRLEFAAYGAIMEAVAGGGFDVVHNNSLHGLPLRLAGSIATPMVTVLHTPPFSPLADDARAARQDSSFIAVSRHLAGQWRDVVPVSTVVGNGIDLSAFPFEPAPTTPPRAIWSGRIVPEKGLHLAIDAARSVGLPIDFAGPCGSPSYWRDEIAPRLDRDAVYLGHLGQAELSARLGRAHVALVTPQWEEPFGLVVAEALACGTPVAGFDRGALPEIVDRDCAVLAQAGDVADLAGAIRQAIRLDRGACRKRADALFDARAMVDSYDALYRDLCLPAGARAGRNRVEIGLSTEA